MKAIRVHEFGGPEKLVLEEVPNPVPGPGQILVRIHAAGVNPVETYIRSGAYARKPELPYTPGADGAGVVIAVGDGIQHFQLGDRVYVSASISGTYAEQSLCSESGVHPLPDHVSFQEGAALGVPYATAYRALFHKAEALSGDWVLVHGASGGVGIAAVQLAHGFGMTVIGTAGTPEGRDLVKHKGADYVLDHNQSDVAEQVLKITNGSGVNVILEMLANKNLAQDLKMLTFQGRVVVIGNRGTIEINPRDAMARDAVIIGMLLYNTPQQDLDGIHAALSTGLENGIVRPVISKEITLAEAARAHEAVMSHGALGKIVLIP